MLQLQVLQLLVKRLVLADLTGVVFLFDDAHATGYAGRVVTSTFLTIDVEFSDDRIAFWTVRFLLRFVVRSVPREKIDGQQFVCFSFLRSDRIQSLKFDQSSAALSETLVEEGCDGNQAVNVFSLKLFLIFDQSHSRFHCSIVIFLVKLPLAEQVEMDGFRSFPRIRQSLVGR